MSIENRLKRLEGYSDSFCACSNTSRTEVYWQDLTSDSKDTELRLTGAPIPDVCPRCFRPVEKESTVIQLVDMEA